MPRERDPNRERAFEMWRDSGGDMDLVDIAAQLGISAGTVRGWKSKDKWDAKLNGTFRDEERSVPKNTERSKHGGAPPGNKNALGNNGGAPKGNRNAAGNSGGDGGPSGNKKALKTGEFESIWIDTLQDDERDLVRRVQTDPLLLLDEEIALLTIRERRMMQRVQKLMNGLTEKQRRVLQQRQTVKESISVYDEKTGKTHDIVVPRDQLVTMQIEETEFRPIEDILRIEDALTRVQEKKLKAIEMKQKHVLEDDPDDEGDGLDSLAAAIELSRKMFFGGGA